MDEVEIRKNAIKRYIAGEKPKQIYSDLSRSKKWFFKWLKRYQTGSPEWYKDHSKAPKNQARRLPAIERQRIIETRRRLESKPFTQTGVGAIKWELEKSGFKFPSDRTINRILSQEGLVKKKHIRTQGS